MTEGTRVRVDWLPPDSPLRAEGKQGILGPKVNSLSGLVWEVRLDSGYVLYCAAEQLTAV